MFNLAVQARGYTVHSVRPDAYSYVWDNSLEPALEVGPGEAV